jgi:hypothetical protein
MIYEANRRIVENPHRIFPQERLVIPGQTVARRDTLLGVPFGEPVVVVAAAEEVQVAAVVPNRSRFYAAPPPPREPTVLTSTQDRDAIIRPAEWLGAPWLGDTTGLAINGHVVAAVDPRSEGDKLPVAFHPRDELYVSARGNVGDRLLVIRVMRDIDRFGWVIKPMGVVRLDSVGAASSRGMITHQYADLQVGDLTMPLPAVPQIANVEPRSVSGGAQGTIIDFLDRQDIYGTTDIAFVDLGAARGLQIGDEIVAFMPERKADEDESETLPEEAVARMRIIKLTSNTATVRITRMHQSSLTRDLPVRVSKQQN